MGQPCRLQAAGRVPLVVLPFRSTCHLLCKAAGMAHYRGTGEGAGGGIGPSRMCQAACPAWVSEVPCCGST